jgi:hypothetical protein
MSTGNYPYAIGLGQTAALIASGGTNAATATAVTTTPSTVDTSAGGGVVLPTMVNGIGAGLPPVAYEAARNVLEAPNPEGLTVQEMEPDSRAAVEIADLWNWF